MSSNDQEVGTSKQDDEKPDTSQKTGDTPQKTMVESKDLPDSIQKDCGDIGKQIHDLSTKPVESIKTSEFDDDDDDEMQLRWEDDDEESNNVTPNVKETVNQTESDLVLKDTDTLQNPSTSQVSSGKELENALTESNNKEGNNETSNLKETVIQTEGDLVLKVTETLENPPTSLVSAVKELENAITESNNKEANDETSNLKETVIQTEGDLVLKVTETLENPPTSLVSAVKELENAITESNNKEANDETSNLKETVIQTEGDLVLKVTETLENPPTSLVSAVNELENAITESNNEESNYESSNVKETVNQTAGDLILKVTETLENPSTSLVSAVKELKNAITESNNEESNNETSNAKEVMNETKGDLKDTDAIENPSNSLVSAVKELENTLPESNNKESNKETPNVKETVNQNEGGFVLKDTDTLENQSTSLVSAVKELENALTESNNEYLDINSSKIFDGTNEQVKKEIGNNSKEILDNIDEIIGTDDATEIKDYQEHLKISIGSSIQPNKTDNIKATGDSEMSEMDVNTSLNVTKDLNDTPAALQKCSDTITLDDSTGSIGKSSIFSSTVNDSFIERDVKFEHGLKRPDMMLEIPTQEIIECLDDFEDSDCEKSDEKDESVDISKQINSLDDDIDSKIMDVEKELPEQQKESISDVIVDISKQMNSSEGDIDSKIMDDEKELLDQQKKSIADGITKDHNGKNTDPGVTDASKTEGLSENNVEMCDLSEKSDIVSKIAGSSVFQSSDKQIVMENPEINEDGNTEILSKPVDTPTISDDNKNMSVEDTLMEVDESNIALETVENDDIEPSKVTEIPAEKINVIVATQATEQDIVTSQDQTKDTSVEPKQTLNVEDDPNKSKTSDSIQETNIQISHEKLEVEDVNLTESKDSNVTPVLDNNTDTEILKDTELSAIQSTDSKLSQSVEPSSESLLDSKSDAEVPKNSELQKTEAIKPILDQNADTEPPKDSSENTESICTESLNIDVITKPISDQKSVTEPSKENDNLKPISDQPSTSKDLNNSSDQVPDTTDEVPEVEDSLGLLAESSRVMDDDEEVDEDEEGADDVDDDDDFDQDDESSNQMTAEHSEDSSAQPDKEDGQTDKEDKTPTAEEKEFNFAVADITEDGAGIDMELTTEETKVSDDVSTEATPAPVEGVDIESDKEPIAPELTDIETVNLSDTSDKETEVAANSILKELLTNQAVPPTSKNKLSEAVVDLEGSSSEDDVQEVNKTKENEVSTEVQKEETKLTSQKDVKSKTAESEKNETESEVDDKATAETCKPDTSMEIFNLDSDDDVPMIAGEVTIAGKPESNKCINPCCPSGARAAYVAADVAARAYFDANKRKKYRVCVACAAAVAERTKGLVNGIKELTPLLQLDLRKVSSETVEISDSDSDDGEGDAKPEVLGESGVKFLEDNLADVINETWIKYKLDERLTDAQSELDKEMQKLEEESKEIDTMLNECQIATDLLRNQLYATFEPERRELTAICIVDTPWEKYSFCESPSGTVTPDKNLKRRTSTISEQPAKRPAIPLGYTPLEDDSKAANIDTSNDDDKDVSVVKLSAEAAPSDLPPPGEISRPRLSPGMPVFAMRNSFCTWVPGKIVDVHPKNPANAFTMCRVRFEIRQKIATRVLSARCLAYLEPAEVRLTIGTRVIALSKENVKTNEPNKKKSFYSGIVAEIPNPVNNYRYLIFFDHGYAQYVQHRDTRVVCESSTLVWEEVHPNSREFVKQYLIAYPERPMVRLHAGQKLKTEWNGKWWVTKVLQVDASLVEVSFVDDRTEWIYRGSTRLAPLFLELQAAERQRARPLPRSNQRRMNMPYVEYTRSEEQNKAEALQAEQARQQQQQHEEMRRQRAVAKKSTALPAPAPTQTTQPNLDSVTSRVVYYTPKNAVKPYKMAPHTCSPKCKRTDVLALKDLRTYNPLAKPLLSGWERQIVRFKGHKEVMYRAPCGRRVRSLRELHRYLRTVQSDMAIDLFDFGVNTHCLAEFVLNKCLVGKKDLSHGKENVPVPCVNYYDESLPEFCSYNTERTPTAGVPLNLDPEFLCGCDCTDDCQDKSKCACWKLTLEGARTIGLDDNVGYEYKRLPEPLPSGIYECNSRCKCKHTCLNRVAQHPLQLKLQVFKTMNRGWGIRALNDVPKGAFLCVYAGNLLTDATANLDGLNEGDEYLAELDYIEVVEQMKEGYEEDIPQEDKKLDRKASESSEEESSSEEEETNAKDDKEDDDFQPGFIGFGVSEFSKRLRKRDRTRKKGEEKEKEKGKEIDKGMEDDGCITISDDEEAKEPTRFMAQSGIGAKEFVSKYKSVRTLYGKDEACYIMDAKVQGNIGRYLNHSCTPNVFVQNVFVDSHDPRFPWVAFFALSHIRAGTELTWNYNYDVGSVPGKVLYCYCGAPNCRGRLL